MGGGGYFRLFPLFLTRWAVRQTGRDCQPSAVMLYFHPWEFDTEQRRLPLGRVSGFRTYVGIRRTQQRLKVLMAKYAFTRAADLAKRLDSRLHDLPRFDLVTDNPAVEAPTERGLVYS